MRTDQERQIDTRLRLMLNLASNGGRSGNVSVIDTVFTNVVNEFLKQQLKRFA